MFAIEMVRLCPWNLHTQTRTRTQPSSPEVTARAHPADEPNIPKISSFQLSANYSNIFRATLQPRRIINELNGN